MDTDQQNQKLSQLLKLKRYEQPPPRYFSHFSVQVLRRIEAGEGVNRNWLEKLWSLFETKPGLTGVAATAACGLVITGVLFAEHGDNTVQLGDFGQPALVPSPSAQGGVQTVSFFSTNPVSPLSSQVPPGQSLFDQMPLGQGTPVLKVSYPVGGGN